MSFAAKDRPSHITGSYRSFDLRDLLWISEQFDIGPVETLTEFVDRGNINLHTFQIQTDGGQVYLLQRLNTDIFTEPHRLMKAMIAWVDAQRDAVSKTGSTAWEPITLIPTTAGEPYLDLSDASGLSVWRMMVKIPNSASYKSLAQILDDDRRADLALQAGRGLAMNADLTSGLDAASLLPSLPGYREPQIYLAQYDSVVGGVRRLDDARGLPQDPVTRRATERYFLVTLEEGERLKRLRDPDLAFCRQAVESRRGLGTLLSDSLSSGRIRSTAIHGDTKLENFLFSKTTGEAVCLVDLDTIMPYTWLADWGDMLRSLSNVAGEKERDLSQVQVDRDIYSQVARGFLQTVREATSEELGLMVDAVKVLTFEIGLRFLADYLRGDTYFCLGPEDPADLNKTRAMVQFTLLQRLDEADEWARATLASVASIR